MLFELPSLGFQPKFYTGGVSASYLPLLYDLVALHQPAKVVTLGFGDGQPHFTFCQALRELNINGRCLTIRRDLPGENPDDDDAWQTAVVSSGESYPDVATFVSGSPVALAEDHPDGSIGLLLLDDCDVYEIARQELLAWWPKIAPTGLVLFHGLALERPQPPRRAWEEVTGPKRVVVFNEGIGMGVASIDPDPGKDGEFVAQLFGRAGQQKGLATHYRSIAARIDAKSRVIDIERANAALRLRQVWLDSVLADRAKAQQVMDHQMREVEQQVRVREELERQMAARSRAFSELQRDRNKAQLIMDTQADQLKHWVAWNQSLASENKKLKAQLAQEKKVIKEAKNACRKRGRCFGLSPDDTEKPRRSIPERIVRELGRIPANLSRAKSSPRAAPEKKTASKPTVDRYAEWITQHEPGPAQLEEQRRAASAMADQPLISLLLPTYNPPPRFLEELFASVVAQTYPNFEICVADGKSDAATKDLLRDWEGKEPRLRLKFLSRNLGIAENTNEALATATGEFFACIDQDDLLAPFALYEVVRAITTNPAGDIFYSDEDRLRSDGQRHSPFFKPEWSPEYLLSSMYLGHLTAYRRALVDRVGHFRKEFDLSQDYDFALRATEGARAVCHIPQVLYHWREHPASGSTGGKPGARATNLAALGAAMERRGLAADIVEYPTANRARLRISAWPKVSIIVPTDSAERARACFEQLPRMTAYPDFEVLVVTNSALADSLAAAELTQPRVRCVRYDKPFNFSDKCNLGAQRARGSRLIFFNDDVESGQADWIQNLIEPLENADVGAVAPKLLYATGKIQHAGLVTGVRGLVGTACHQWAGDSTDYTNFAQSMRDVSALSAACLAMRREDFFAVGQFDAVNTPIAHSDLDLCFKVRAAGMRCVYTPFVTMTHRGHASIGALEEVEKTPADGKASVYLLKRWAGYACHDPYYPDNMRDWLYEDSPTPIRMWARDEQNAEATGRELALLLVSHDLSWSGAPLILLHVAKWCRTRGFFVVILSPTDGPLRGRFVEAGIPVLTDPLIATGHRSFAQFAREFDCVVASTIFAAPMVRAVKEAGIPHLWWIHEGRVAEHYLREDRRLRLALEIADVIVTPDTVSSRVYQPFTDRTVRVLPYGIPDPGPGIASAGGGVEEPVRFLLLGTVEQRKGQQVLLEALRLVSADSLRDARFAIVGRPQEAAIAEQIEAAAKNSAFLTYADAVSHEEALLLIRETDVMVSCSSDETGPLILMEALAMGKPILSTTVGVVAEYLADEEVGLFFPPGNPQRLAEAIERLVRERGLLTRFGRNARESYQRYFTFERFCGAFEALVSEVISTSPSSADQPAGAPSRGSNGA